MIKNHLELENEKIGLTVITEKSGLTIIGHWHVSIEKEYLIDYVRNYNKSIHKGFIEAPQYGMVMLTHKDCKLSLTQEQAQLIIELIKNNFMF